ncbi:transferase hexapeptide (six repeat-containing protein) [Rhodoblastus acidophilus]|uniref:Transferase hexapeptide (Six repeat-containing protein) n=1 Tax=Rhodoblastus acidophilus TaxID=1074 RepID=A0A212Q2P9_RHOAC|nr:acyltransferase [Rhodoblastus acidophilus]PPQ37158.1 hypothetical protein CKO16_15380 [Rhodoblastus acidophilus]RAI18133.1 hypothetical protein CH337_14945 [Rhodoblastus acidophilus]SNB53631.1 transferase hexapeptide (six repeat-containing protein) [Rhodoblastus acidophilus]
MPIVFNGSLDKNKCEVQGDVAGNAVVNFASENCELFIGPDCRLDGFEINFQRPNQKVFISGQNALRGQIHLTAPNTKVTIGARTRTNSYIWMNLAERDTQVAIGADCLLASVRFRTSDSHKIIDIATNERLNPPGDIIVEDGVWIAEDVLMLKGATVGRGSIIGARSTVTSTVPAQCLAVGSPARVLRTGVKWVE